MSDSDFTLDTSHGEIIVSSDDDYSESFPGKHDDQAWLDEVRTAMNKQKEQINTLRAQQFAAIHTRNWDEVNRLHHEILQLERGEVTAESIPLRTVRAPEDDHGEGPLSKSREANLPDSKQRLVQAIEKKLADADMPNDLNFKQNPKIWKSGFRAGLREAIRVVQSSESEQ